MNELEQLRLELEQARAQADYYRNLVLLDENNPETIAALDRSQDRLDRLDPANAAGQAPLDGPERNVGTFARPAVTPGRRIADRLRYLAMVPVNILVAIPVSIVAAVALARIMSASLLKKGFLEVLVRNATQSVRITVDQHRNDTEVK
jgi:hypothetical protein